MKAMLLAAGRGERMRPLTDVHPKPLLKAGGKPLIVWHLEKLAAAGFSEVIINHAWLGEQIPAALGDGRAFGLRLRYSAEAEALETAGGIAQALPMLTEGEADDAPFAVISSDAWSDADYRQLPEVAQTLVAEDADCWCLMVNNPGHHQRGDFSLAEGVLRLAPSHAAVPIGHSTPANTHPAHLATPDTNTVLTGSAAVAAPATIAVPTDHSAPTSAHPAPPRARQTDGNGHATTLTYAGIGVFRPRMFASIEAGTRSPLRPWLEQSIREGRARGQHHPGRWFDVGTPERLAELDQLLKLPAPSGHASQAPSVPPPQLL